LFLTWCPTFLSCFLHTPNWSTSLSSRKLFGADHIENTVLLLLRACSFTRERVNEPLLRKGLHNPAVLLLLACILRLLPSNGRFSESLRLATVYMTQYFTVLLLYRLSQTTQALLERVEFKREITFHDSPIALTLAYIQMWFSISSVQVTKSDCQNAKGQMMNVEKEIKGRLIFFGSHCRPDDLIIRPFLERVRESN
jgi:hypothetical protein